MLTCTDQAGGFTVMPKSGNHYLMVVCDYDSNDILAEEIPDRNSSILQKAFKILHNKTFLKGCKYTIYTLDN